MCLAGVLAQAQEAKVVAKAAKSKRAELQELERMLSRCWRYLIIPDTAVLPMPRCMQFSARRILTSKGDAPWSLT